MRLASTLGVPERDIRQTLERLSGKYYLKDALEGLVRYQIPFEVLGDKFNQDMVAQEVNNQRSIEDKLQLVALSGFNFKLFKFKSSNLPK